MNHDHIKFLREHYDFEDLPAYSTSTDEVKREWYDVFFELQGGACAICKCKLSDKRNRRKGRPTAGEERFDLDHDRVTDKLRGLLCHSCNMGLGKFDDSLANLRAAIDYLLGRHLVDDDGDVE
jgi:hypothetical protein